MKEPFTFYKTNDGLKFYFVNCGSGLTHLIIFPNNTVMLYDCNLVENDDDSKRDKKYILDLFKKVIPYKDDEAGNRFQPIDIFVNSHRDQDHMKGLKDVNANFPIQSIWDSGCHGANTNDSEYDFYMRLRRDLKKKDSKNLIVPTPSSDVFYKIGEAEIYCLCSSKDYEEDSDILLFESADKEQHTKCIVLLIYYKGRKILLTGDSDWKAWKEEIVPCFKDSPVNYENTDVLIASHHGSRSFFTREDEIDEELYPESTYIESIKLINPIITLISCAEYEYKGYHFPNREALKLYRHYSSNQQVYTTNDCGTFYGRIDTDGNFSVTPERFNNINGTNDNKIILKCKNEKDEIIKNNTECFVGSTLRFSLIGLGGVLDDIDNPSVWWEVCNAGELIDDSHHEIYRKDESGNEGKYSFVRILSYEGTHLLRCRVKNRKKKFDQTVVFVVHGKRG